MVVCIYGRVFFRTTLISLNLNNYSFPQHSFISLLLRKPFLNLSSICSSSTWSIDVTIALWIIELQKCFYNESSSSSIVHISKICAQLHSEPGSPPQTSSSIPLHGLIRDGQTWLLHGIILLSLSLSLSQAPVGRGISEDGLGHSVGGVTPDAVLNVTNRQLGLQEEVELAVWQAHCHVQHSVRIKAPELINAFLTHKPY